MAEVALLFPEDADDGRAEILHHATRIAEALLFASSQPLSEKEIGERLPSEVAVAEVLKSLRAYYQGRGVTLVCFGEKWAFRTAEDLSWILSKEVEDQRKLSKPALETLAIIAFHQPVTRAEIEDIRGVALSKGTLDLLLETGWVRLRGRRRIPGRPITYGTTEAFLLHFGLEQIGDLPGLDDLKAAGLFDGRLPSGFGVPKPDDFPHLTEDEDPLEESEAQLLAEEQIDEAENNAETPADTDGEMQIVEALLP